MSIVQDTIGVIRQDIKTYTSAMGVCAVANNTSGVVCGNVFKNKDEIRNPLTALWVEVINHMEQTKYENTLGRTCTTLYNKGEQSCPYQNLNKIEVSGT